MRITNFLLMAILALVSSFFTTAPASAFSIGPLSGYVGRNLGAFLDTYKTGNQGKLANGIDIDEANTFDTQFGISIGHLDNKWQSNYDDLVQSPTTVTVRDNTSFKLAGVVTTEDESVSSPQSSTLFGLGLVLTVGLINLKVSMLILKVETLNKKI